jgi:hypothetical protein
MPSNSTGFFSFVAISWMTGLMWKAYRHGLTEDDLYDLQVGSTSLSMQELCYLIMILLFVKILSVKKLTVLEMSWMMIELG